MTKYERYYLETLVTFPCYGVLHIFVLLLLILAYSRYPHHHHYYYYYYYYYYHYCSYTISNQNRNSVVLTAETNASECAVIVFNSIVLLQNVD